MDPPALAPRRPGRYHSGTMRRKRTIIALTAVAGLTAFALGGFWFLVHAPQTIAPPPQWPFTEQSRKEYDPFGERSRRNVEFHLRQKMSPRPDAAP